MTLNYRLKRTHWALSRKMRAVRGVLLDGKPVPNAFYADGRRGVVRSYKTDEAGHLVLKPDFKEIEIIEQRGRVQWL